MTEALPGANGPLQKSDLKEALETIIRASQANFDHLSGQQREFARLFNKLADDVANLYDLLGIEYTPSGNEESGAGGEQSGPFIRSSLVVEESDGVPSVEEVETLQFKSPDFLVTDQGNDTARVTINPAFLTTDDLGSLPIMGGDGADGEMGSPGPPGEAGATGAPGSTGPAGQAFPMWMESDPGEDGWVYPPGTPGSPGPTGNTGATGSMGPPGTDGADGADEWVYPPGNTGATGSQGLRGDMGPPGEDGAIVEEPFPLVGPQGTQGPQGSTGSMGPPGIDFEGVDEPWPLVGAQGSAGVQGTQGNMGPPGLDGMEGVEEPFPILGQQGSPGMAGAAGVAGAAGPPGTDGNDGDDWWHLPGERGPIGPTGLQGPLGPPGDAGDAYVEEPFPIVGQQGVSGSAGAAGAAGVAGPPGLDGQDGEDWWAIPGPTGATGPQGPAGSGGGGGAAMPMPMDMEEVEPWPGGRTSDWNDVYVRRDRARFDGRINYNPSSSVAVSINATVENDYIGATNTRGQTVWAVTNSASASTAGFTGIGATGEMMTPSDGKLLIIQNVGTNEFRLFHENGGSSAANRFTCPYAQDMVIQAKQTVVLMYVDSLTRWTVLGSTGVNAGSAGNANPLTYVYRASDQNLVVGTEDIVLWDTEVQDDLAMHSTVSNTGRFTVPSGGSGRYLVIGHIVFDAGGAADSRVNAKLRKNNTTGTDGTILTHALGAGNSVVQSLAIAWAGDLVDGDWVSFTAIKTGGSDQNILSGLEFSRVTVLKLNTAVIYPAVATVVQDLGAARRSGTFDITGLSGLTAGKYVNISMSAGAIASKGNARDEFEMTPIQATGYVVNTTTIRVYWNTANEDVAVGNYEFVYAVAA